MSNFPSRTDIVTAMQNPQVSFKSNELLGGKVIQKGSRVIQYSGGYTIVFPFIKKNGEKVAVRLWIADIDDAKKRSLEISKFLKTLKSSYFVGFDYIDDSILVSGQIYPVVIMNWVEGATIKDYINDNINNPRKISKLADDFKNMVEFFHNKNIAHGDLQHGNILVKDNGDLVAIDYDSMYISSLDGMTDAIKGLVGYQHPARQKNKFISPKLDYFSELVIYLSLLVFSEYPEKWKDYYETEDILFSREDYNDFRNSNLINELLSSKNTTIAELTHKLTEQLMCSNIDQLSTLESLLVDKKKIVIENISSKWNNQPNSSVKKEVKLPLIKNISDKF